ncbi:MAG: DUF4364 family protein [Ruminococcaceae bacterium]|nr:DUF4364 family protein [Oscillospiraceae bacterium]
MIPLKEVIKVESNAISAGIGSLISIAEIKVLICYVIGGVNAPVPGKQLANMFNIEGIANYFEVIDALEALTKSENLIYCADDDTYTVTKKGSDAADTLKSILPFTIKEKAFALTAKMISRLKNAKETRIETIKENGIMYLICSAVENGVDLMSVKIMVTDETQASAIKERFLDDPSKVYTGLVDLLTGK